MPRDASRVIEVGCSSGSLAREYKKVNGNCYYVGVEIVPEYVKLAQRYCDKVLELDIENVDEVLLRGDLQCDCWVFGDVLEHLRDPWHLLGKIRQTISNNGSVVACIPNAQHWSVQTRLNSGALRYEEAGLLDKTHLRWFTRTTIIEMFQNAGFEIIQGTPRIFDKPERQKVLPAIRMMASLTGADPERAVQDAIPFQYVVRAIPTLPAGLRP
jgi:2-polyprenyl-3-methyl-5-hydroxy-6-metoxy-1,4-benzoquinol methylase